MSGLWICLVILHLIHHSHAVFWSQQFLQRAFTPAHYNFTESVKFAAPKCIEEYQNFVRGLFAAEPWAQRVLDSWSLTTSGLFSGNRFNYGHFDQCLESSFKEDVSQYCLINGWNPNIGQRLWNGVCLPKSCTTEAVHTILANLYPNLDLVVQEVFVCTTRVSDENPIVSKALQVFVCVVGLVMCSTAYHLYFGSRKKLLTSFSLIRNAKSLFSTSKSGRIEVLDGLRVLGMLAVLRLHMFTVHTVGTKSEAYTTFVQEWWWNLIYGGHLSVNTFFVISGFIMALKFIRIIDQKKSWGVLNFLINRYVRLTAPVGFLILFTMACFSTVQGPNTVYIHNELRLCEEKWWMNLLHLQGYLTPYRCLNHTWYVAVDAHLCLFAPVLFFCLMKRSRKFVIGLASVIIIVSSVGSILQRFQYFDTLYEACLTHTRLSPWFIGIILGFVVYHFQSRNRTLSLRQSRAIVIGSYSAMFVIFWAKSFEDLFGAYNLVYETVQHVLFGVAVAFLIFALTNEPKEQSSFCKKILSNPSFLLFSKLSYSFYLLHIPIIQLLYATNRNPMHLTEMTIFMQAIVVFWVSILASIPFTLLFEMPFVNLLSALLPE